MRELYEAHRAGLDQIDSPRERSRSFVELHAWTQANELKKMESVRDAMRERGVQVHPFVFDADQGRCVELMLESSSGRCREGNRR